MVPGRVSIVVPSRNERHLARTVVGLLAAAHGDVEVMVMLEGQDETLRLPDDPRVKVHLHPEPVGMRPSINEGAVRATGEYLMKVDAHVIMGDGYDTILKADCDRDWLVVPTRHSIDEATWTIRQRNFNYSLLSFPFLPSMYGAGFHAVTFAWDQNKAVNRDRAHLPVDDVMGAQGSCWFTPTEYFRSFPPLDHEALYFYQENQETMLRVLATGGRAVVNKGVAYGHLHKGKDNRGADGRTGRGYYLDVRKKRASEALVVDWCLNGWPWPGAVRPFESIVEQHWWLISRMTDPRYAWPADWRDWEKHSAAFENRPPDQIPAHT